MRRYKSSILGKTSPSGGGNEMESNVVLKGSNLAQLVESLGLRGKIVKVCFSWGKEPKFVRGKVVFADVGAIVIEDNGGIRYCIANHALSVLKWVGGS